jgi:hypothetical protein
MSKSTHYTIIPEQRFRLDRVITGPGVELVIAPEAEDYLVDLGLLKALDGAYDAGVEHRVTQQDFDSRLQELIKGFQNGQPGRMQAFLQELLGYTRLTPQVVNHDQVMRLVAKHLPELAPKTT